MTTRPGFLLLAAVACGDGTSDPTARIDELHLVVSTYEIEVGRQLMVVGELGSANAIAFRNSIGADPGQVSFTSSNPAVIAVQRTAPTDATLTASAAGSVEIVAGAQGLTDRVRVDVVDAPLPVDQLRVQLAPISSDLDATYDVDGNLVSVALSPNESAALDLLVTRNGALVTRIPFVLVSSQPSAVRVDEHCRLEELDPGCSVFGTWGWVTGIHGGASVVSMTVRNQTRTFAVEVR